MSTCLKVTKMVSFILAVQMIYENVLVSIAKAKLFQQKRGYQLQLFITKCVWIKVMLMSEKSILRLVWEKDISETD